MLVVIIGVNFFGMEPQIWPNILQSASGFSRISLVEIIFAFLGNILSFLPVSIYIGLLSKQVDRSQEKDDHKIFHESNQLGKPRYTPNEYINCFDEL